MNHSCDFSVCRGSSTQHLCTFSKSDLNLVSDGCQVIDLLPRGTERGTKDIKGEISKEQASEEESTGKRVLHLHLKP